MKGHYDKNYFLWHKHIGEFGGIANLIKFEPYIRKNDRVVDFGCGGGYLLKNIKCREKLGIEINPESIRYAQKLGHKVYRSLSQVPDGWADIIVSNNTLEHVENPLEELKKVYRKLKRKGKAVFVVPCEASGNKYSPKDINQHLFSWSPMAIGNLFTKAGFQVLESKPLYHKWPKNNYKTIAQVFGMTIFHIICRINGMWNRSSVQVRVVAKK